MRLDLIYDFLQNLQPFFKSLLITVEEETYDTLKDSVLIKGNEVFNSVLYFCCYKQYYNLTPHIYSTNTAKCLIVKRQDNLWKISNKKESRLFTNKEVSIIRQKLNYSYPPKNKFCKYSIEFTFKAQNTIVFITGFCINSGKTNQSYYLWKLQFKYSKHLLYPDFGLLKEKELMKEYYKSYQHFSKNNKLLKQPLTLRDFIRENNINPRIIRINFKKCMGVSFYNYHTQYRLLKALHLLLFTEDPIGEIAYKCNYENYRVFLNSFRQKLMCSPTDFRQSTH